MSFEITFLGASGGPLEGTTCGILLKPAHLSYDELLNSPDPEHCLLFIDAGAGVASLAEIIYREQTLKVPSSKLLNYYPDSLHINDYVQTQITTPFQHISGDCSPFHLAQKVLCIGTEYLITHPHLDHIAGLVVNSAGFSVSKPKTIHGCSHTIEAMEKHIFNGVIWPNMPFFKVLNLETHEFGQTWKCGVYDIEMFKLSHGKLMSNECVAHIQSKKHTSTMPMSESNSLSPQQYISSSFLISNSSTRDSILIFGDCEGDSVSQTSTNLQIWRHVAPLIIDKSLKAIVLECSNCNGIKENELYGHMVPDHLIGEFKALEEECRKVSGLASPLQDLHIIVNHVKEPVIGGGAEMKNFKDVELRDPRQQVLKELNELNEREKLGIRFSIALSGISLVI